MVVLTQGPGPFVSRRDVCESSSIDDIESVYDNEVSVLPTVKTANRPALKAVLIFSLERFDFSSSLFCNFSEERLSSFEGPPEAEALFALSAWIQ